MQKHDALLRLDSLEWAFECHLTSKLPTDLKIGPEFMKLLHDRLNELKEAISKI